MITKNTHSSHGYTHSTEYCCLSSRIVSVAGDVPRTTSVYPRRDIDLWQQCQALGHMTALLHTLHEAALSTHSMQEVNGHLQRPTGVLPLQESGLNADSDMVTSADRWLWGDIVAEDNVATCGGYGCTSGLAIILWRQ
jgi:hypothetical protein